MFADLVTDSFLRPRVAARRILALRLDAVTIVQAAVAVTAVGIVLGWLAMRLAAGDIDAVSVMVLSSPLTGAAAELAVLAVIAWLTFRIGRLFGGTGGLLGAAALVVWLNALMALIQVLQIVFLVVLPPLAGILAIVTLIWALWAYANFVTELHGFEQPMFVLGGVVLTGIVLFFGLAMVLAVLGVTPQEAG